MRTAAHNSDSRENSAYRYSSLFALASVPERNHPCELVLSSCCLEVFATKALDASARSSRRFLSSL